VTVVADTGPLIALAKIEALDVLSDLYEQVITGPTVYTEAVLAGLAVNAPDAVALQDAYKRGILTVRMPVTKELPYPDLLHAGEAESTRLAIELEAEYVLMDDFRARQVALRNLAAAHSSARVKGTLGLIVSAVQAQIIHSEQAVDWIQTLKGRPDVWLAPALCDAVIKSLRRL
jgi:predicted nucleic acid-binding protein